MLYRLILIGIASVFVRLAMMQGPDHIGFTLTREKGLVVTMFGKTYLERARRAAQP